MNNSSNNALATATTTRNGLKLFTCVFLAFAAFFLVFKRTDWFPWVGECHPNEKTGYFLAYCHSVRFGDYEHYAYFHESEPKAVEHAKAANVVFLGSSNTQFAFSTNAVSAFFANLPYSHYVLGFGHGAQSGVAEAVAQKLELAPDVWVINADPFFTGEMNATFARIYEPVTDKNETSNTWKFLPLWFRPDIHGEHARKRVLQQRQNTRCNESAGEGFWCQGGADTLHRNAENGHWFVENYRDNLQLPVANHANSHMEELNEYIGIAEEFTQRLGIDKRCLVITATPRSDTPKKYAQSLAEAIGAGFVFPPIDNLKTIDGFHLDRDSAERWSKALMQELKVYLERCSIN